MKYFVYALYSPSYKMIKIGRTQNFKKRWKDLSHWGFDDNKSFALCCETNQGHKRIEDTVKTFFKFHPSISALSTKKDGYTECFDERITEELRYFFFHFSQHYPHGCSYINNIKPFIGASSVNHKDKHSLVEFAEAWVDDLNSNTPMKIIFGRDTLQKELGSDVDLSDF